MTAWAAAGAVALAGSAAAAGPPSVASNTAAAQADAAALLAALRLPTGAAASATEPAGDAGVLGHPGPYPATPNLVEDTGWWTTAVPVATVVSLLKTSLRPVGSALVGSGFGSGPNQPSVFNLQFGWPEVTGVLGWRQLVVDVTALADGSTGIRADSEVVWVTPRPADEIVPSGSRRLVVSFGQLPAPGQPAPRTVRVRSAATIRRVVSLINHLPAAQPGVSSCPAFGGLRLVFSHPSIVATVGACGVMSLTIDGRAQPPLATDWFPGSGLLLRVSFVQRLDALLGVRAATGGRTFFR
jgi:hypothetical protein